jgi:hypothetical protein
MPDAELAKLSFKTALGPAQLAAALAIFQLLDSNGDKYLKLDELRKAQVCGEGPWSGAAVGLVDPVLPPGRMSIIA